MLSSGMASGLCGHQVIEGRQGSCRTGKHSPLSRSVCQAGPGAGLNRSEVRRTPAVPGAGRSSRLVALAGAEREAVAGVQAGVQGRLAHHAAPLGVFQFRQLLWHAQARVCPAHQVVAFKPGVMSVRGMSASRTIAKNLSQTTWGTPQKQKKACNSLLGWRHVLGCTAGRILYGCNAKSISPNSARSLSTCTLASSAPHLRSWRSRCA